MCLTDEDRSRLPPLEHLEMGLGLYIVYGGHGKDALVAAYTAAEAVTCYCGDNPFLDEPSVVRVGTASESITKNEILINYGEAS